MAKVYYFGVANGDCGHFCYEKPWTQIGYSTRNTFSPWKYYDLDGKLAPVLNPEKANPETNKYYYLDRKEAPQGQVKVHHKDGWTALSFWDRTQDPRGASNSSFLIDKIVDFKEGIELAQASWPQLFKRFEKAGLELKEYEGT